MTENFTDHQLITRYLKGDEKSFEILIARYTQAIYGFAYGYVKDSQVANDITQQVFIKVWKNVKKVDKNKSFKSWLYTIAKNTALDALKKKKAIPFSQFETEKGNILANVLPDQNLLPDALAVVSQNNQVFKKAIKQLSEKYQSVLSLYYYQYLNFREIAAVQQESINTIKSRHRRGLVLLKKSLQQYSC